MESYLRPRRGKASTAISQGLVLKRGEIFFEYSEEGLGIGSGNIKMGDGTTSYSALPYFLESASNSTIPFTDSNTPTDKELNPSYLVNIKPANTLTTILTNLKRLLVNFNSQLTSLDTNKVNKNWELVESWIGTSDGDEYDLSAALKEKLMNSIEYSEVLIIFQQISGSSLRYNSSFTSPWSLLSSNFLANIDNKYCGLYIDDDDNFSNWKIEFDRISNKVYFGTNGSGGDSVNVYLLAR